MIIEDISDEETNDFVSFSGKGFKGIQLNIYIIIKFDFLIFFCL